MTHSDVAYWVAVVAAAVAFVWAVKDNAIYGGLIAIALGAIAVGLLLAS